MATAVQDGGRDSEGEQQGRAPLQISVAVEHQAVGSLRVAESQPTGRDGVHDRIVPRVGHKIETRCRDVLRVYAYWVFAATPASSMENATVTSGGALNAVANAMDSLDSRGPLPWFSVHPGVAR